MKEQKKQRKQKEQKKKSTFAYLRYRNLNQELAQYGYDLTPKRAVLSYFILLLVALSIGVCYKLSYTYMIAIGGMGLLLLPVTLIQTRKGQYYTEMFSLVNNYMDQFLYSFRRTGTILNTLKETQTIVEEGAFYTQLEEAIQWIQNGTKSEDVEVEALAMIEAFFQCEKVNAIHRFAIGAQRRGGDASGSISLFSKNRAMWVERIQSLQKEFLSVKRNILIALIATLLICLVPLYLLGGEMDISESSITQISATALIGVCMLIYVKANKKLARNWIQTRKESKQMDQKYLQVKEYNEEKERKKSERIGMIPALLFLAGFLYMRELWVLLLGMGVTLFFFRQHTIGHHLAKKRVDTEIKKQFPGWLMNVALLIQTENVQVAIRKSIEDAPKVFIHPLQTLVEELEQTPNAIRPYHEFLKEYKNPDIQSAMKILYSLSSGVGGDAKEQMEELIARNNAMIDAAEKLAQEDKVAGMKVYILLPSLLASFKLMVDMGMLLVTFLANLAM